MASMKKDMEDNPDMTMKLQQYYEKVKTDDPSAKTPDDPQSSSSSQPKIAHRSEKELKADEARLAKLNKPELPYNRLGGWQTIQNRDQYDLELPSTSTPHQFVAKQPEKRKPIQFLEKSISSLSSAAAPTSTILSTGFLPVKTEPEIAFKKRRVDRSNMRRRDDD